MKLARKESERHIPILRGTVSKDGKTIRCHCPVCDRPHIHGYEGKGLHHRRAHCWSYKSPFKETGYYIAPLRKKDREAIN